MNDHTTWVEVQHAEVGKPYIISVAGHKKVFETGWATMTEAFDADGKRYMERTYYPNREDVVVLLGEKRRMMGIVGNYSTYYKALTPIGITWLHEITILYEDERSDADPGCSSGDAMRVPEGEELPDRVESSKTPPRRNKRRRRVGW